MPADRGLNLRAPLKAHRNPLRETVQRPPSGGVKAVTDRPTIPAGGGLSLRGASTVVPTQHASDHPMARSSPVRPSMSPKSPTGRRKVEAAFREVHADEPGIVAKTRRKKGARAAERQRTAIALSKARQAGVRIPRRTG